MARHDEEGVVDANPQTDEENKFGENWGIFST